MTSSGRPRRRLVRGFAGFFSYSLFLVSVSSLLCPSDALVHLRSKPFSFTFIDAPARFGDFPFPLLSILGLGQPKEFANLGRCFQLFRSMGWGSADRCTPPNPLMRALFSGLTGLPEATAAEEMRGLFWSPGACAASRRRLGTPRMVDLRLRSYTTTRRRAVCTPVSAQYGCFPPSLVLVPVIAFPVRMGARPVIIIIFLQFVCQVFEKAKSSSHHIMLCTLSVFSSSSLDQRRITLWMQTGHLSFRPLCYIWRRSLLLKHTIN